MFKKLFFGSVILVLVSWLVSINASKTYSWGFFGHQRINRMAVFTLPPGMVGFYKKHIDFITEHAVDPDKRRYGVKEEAPRHHIDLDHYGEDAWNNVPHHWKDAVAKLTEDTLMEYGIVPWHIEKMVYRLTDAFKTENLDKILRTSSDLGHYIADCHVPLHMTENYNGQMTNQKGIHGFWESRIPELNADNYDYFVGRSYYVEHINPFIWDVVKVSFAAHDSVLDFERILNARTSPDQKYCVETRGNVNIKTYCEDYSNEFDRMLNGQVERRLRQAVIAVGSLWYTAWVNAGQPDLSRLDNKEITDQLKEEIAAEDKMWETGKASNKVVKGHDD